MFLYSVDGSVFILRCNSILVCICKDFCCVLFQNQHNTHCQVEYAALACVPWLHEDIGNLEKLQCRRDRFVVGNYQWIASVTSMIQTLGCNSLEGRRRSLEYKIHHNIDLSWLYRRYKHIKISMVMMCTGIKNKLKLKIWWYIVI